MPTGYTEVLEKHNITFRQFALRCARAFGVCIMQRDESLDVAPRPREPDSSLDRELQKFRNKLAELSTMSLDQAKKISEKEYAKSLEVHRKSVERTKSVDESYRRMREKVVAWNPPTREHDRLKEFMLEQIDMCYEPDRDYEKWAPKLLDPEAWLADQIRLCSGNIDFWTKLKAQDLKHCAESKVWLEALEASL